MFSKLFFVAAFLLINGRVSNSEFICNNVGECSDELFTKAANVILTGSESLYIDSVDPLFFDIVEGNLTIIDYRLLDNTLTGLKNCKIVNATTNFKNLKLNLDLECPAEAKIVGKFNINGRIFSGLISGSGDYEFVLGSFKANLNANFVKKTRSDGTFFLAIKNFIAKSQVKTPVKAVFTNLITNDRSKFTPLTWKAIGDIIQEPILFASFKKILNNMNVYLRSAEFQDKTYLAALLG